MSRRDMWSRSRFQTSSGAHRVKRPTRARHEEVLGDAFGQPLGQPPQARICAHTRVLAEQERAQPGLAFESPGLAGGTRATPGLHRGRGGIRITDVIWRTVSARRGAGAAPSRAEADASAGVDDVGSAAGGF